jgi:hypothetical protein
MTDLKALIAIGPKRSSYEFPSWILRRDHRRRHRPEPKSRLSADDREFLRDIGLG